MRKLLIIAVTLGTSAGAADRPDVVLVLSDDESRTDYGFMGHELVQTHTHGIVWMRATEGSKE